MHPVVYKVELIDGIQNPRGYPYVRKNYDQLNKISLLKSRKQKIFIPDKVATCHDIYLYSTVPLKQKPFYRQIQRNNPMSKAVTNQQFKHVKTNQNEQSIQRK